MKHKPERTWRATNTYTNQQWTTQRKWPQRWVIEEIVGAKDIRKKKSGEQWMKWLGSYEIQY